MPAAMPIAIDPSAPRHPGVHLFETTAGSHAFVVNGSRIFNLDRGAASALRNALEHGGRKEVDTLLDDFGVSLPRLIDDGPPPSPPLHAISLAVAQKCNLGCTYCYAQQGDFGAAARNMPFETAAAAIDMLISGAAPGSRVNITFLGGEPLANRPVLRAATEYAVRAAAARAVRPTFSITTNGTLLNPEDGDFFEKHAFAVTVSLDGLREAHDARRPFKHGGGSFDRIIARVRPLLAMQRNMQISVRATVTLGNDQLLDSLRFFFDAGFHSAGFSPMLRSPNGEGEMNGDVLREMLNRMIECGREFEGSVVRGARFPFNNIVNAMRELHRGTHRPYPCGAGAGYLGVAADGQLAACHRFVGDEDGAMGDLASGIDTARRRRWMRERHVHRQEPCRECWARYLCGGGCHHEVIGRGRLACDYIRGWLHYCLQAYGRLVHDRPEWFASEEPAHG
jgi:uncharacterized protein